MKIKKITLVGLSLLFSACYTFGQIDLGTASSFAIFTSIGAINNLGSSNFIGDVGTNEGTISGYPPATLTGQIHEVNSTTIQAAIDVEIAYNNLSEILCEIELGSALEGLTLTPNVYCIQTAASLYGDLILDGENNPNSLFIIKINGVLDVVGLSSKIILINLASANNVYWLINGAVNIGDSAVFRGTILANGALTFEQGSQLIGHGLTRAGAISTTNTYAAVSNGFILPIKLIIFEGKKMNNHNILSWSTASELNNDYFTLERTTDGIFYVSIARINTTGINTSINHYSYSDFDFEKKLNYYRLKQTDFDGESETFNIITINNLNEPKHIKKVYNLMGQEVDKEYNGLRIIHFTNGDFIKIIGKYVETF